MVDLHCHVLPGVDDGAQTWEDALEFGRVAVREGFTALVATPHWDVVSGDAPPTLSVAEIEALVQQVQALWDQHGLDVKLYPGGEIRIAVNLPELFDAGRLPILGGVGSRLLIEFPYHHIPPYTEDVLFQLRLRGAIPVLAHPERNRDVAANIQRLQRLAELEHEVAMDAQSLLGEDGPDARGVAKEALANGWVTYLVSDAHQPEHLARLGECRRRVNRYGGSEAFEQLTTKAPASVLNPT